MTDLTTKQEIEIHDWSFNERNTHVTVDYTVSDRDGEANVSQSIPASTLIAFIKEEGLNALELFVDGDVEPAQLDASTYLHDNPKHVLELYLDANL